MKRINISIPPDLLAEVDETRGDVPRSRWIQRALEKALGETGPAGPSAAASISAPSRTPRETLQHGSAMARQAKLNAAKAGKR